MQIDNDFILFVQTRFGEEFAKKNASMEGLNLVRSCEFQKRSGNFDKTETQIHIKTEQQC